MKKVSRVLLVGLVAVAAFGVFAKLPFRDTAASDENYQVFFDENYKSPGCNVILISIDTLRADHLGCYGYPQNTTPNIDEFSKDSVLFKETIAQAPSTTPSHASIFTSSIPSHHGAFFSMRKPIPQDLVTMAEILRENGYKTISFNGGAQIAAEFGFDQGFDTYDSWQVKKNQPSITLIDKVDFTIEKVDSAIDWIRTHPNEKFFLFLHTYEVHHPYTPKKEYLDLFEKHYSGDLPAHISGRLLEKINKGNLEISKEDEQHIVNTYDAEIYSMDIAFGTLVDFLKKEDLYDSIVVIFTSDHGEEFREHGWTGWHSHTLYDELLKVPLMVKFENSKYGGTVIEEQVRSIDILPTLLDILNIASLECFEGTSLVKRFNSTNRKELLAVSEQDTVGQRHPATIRTKRWKLYDRLNDVRLFNLKSDPLEQKDVRKGNKGVCNKLQDELSYWLSRKQSVVEAGEADLDEETLKRLKSLGYIDQNSRSLLCQ